MLVTLKGQTVKDCWCSWFKKSVVVKGIIVEGKLGICSPGNILAMIMARVRT